VPTDWQFIVVTMLAACALWVLVRQFLPTKKASGRAKADPACAHCASNEQARSAAPHRAPRTTTTPVVSLHDLRETARKN
jgi:hypothetical protein